MPISSTLSSSPASCAMRRARVRRDAGGKAKDLSLLKLRPDLLRYAPDVAERFGILPRDAAALEAEEATLEAESDAALDDAA